MNEKAAHDSEHHRSIVITRRVRRGYEAAYEALLNGLLKETKSFPGFEGGQVVRPNSPDRLEYQITLHFEGGTWTPAGTPTSTASSFGGWCPDLPYAWVRSCPRLPEDLQSTRLLAPP